MRSLIGLTVMIAGLALATWSGDRARRVTQGDAAQDDWEVRRLRSHFDTVENELRAAAVGHLTVSQRQTRADLIEWLGEYRDARVFPRNDRFRNVAMPYFRDATGRLCAVAYLLSRSGRTDVVDRIARTQNHAFVRELRADRALGQWLDSVGLTLEEAARVQPAYSPQGPTPYYGLATFLVGGSALISASLNTFVPHRTTGWLGLVTGASAALLGLSNLHAEGADGNLAAVNVAVGLTGLALSVRGFTHRRGERQSAPRLDGSTRERLREIVVAPMVAPGGRGAEFGVAVRARF